MTNQQITSLIARRVRKGANADESAALLAGLVVSHSGENLAHALVYNDFATEAQAAKIAA